VKKSELKPRRLGEASLSKTRESFPRGRDCRFLLQSLAEERFSFDCPCTGFLCLPAFGGFDVSGKRVGRNLTPSLTTDI
jgi:hypothetical protein